MKWFKFIIVTFVILILVGCSNKPRTWWTEPVIAVMADSTEWKPMQSVMNQTFERVLRTPQSETLFTIRRVPNAKFERYSTFQYLIIAATLNSKGPVGSMIRNVLADSSIQARMKAGEFLIFTQQDQWARDQLVVILLAKDVYTLRDNIEANGEYLYSLFNDDFSERLMTDLLAGRINKDIEKDMI